MEKQTVEKSNSINSMEEKETTNDIIKIDENTPADVIEASEVVDKMEEHQKQAIATIVKYQFKGPLPHPSILKGYNDIQDGIADRIVKMAEKDQDAEIENNKQVLKYQARDSLLGAIFSFLTVMTTFIVGLILILNDKDVVGMGSLLTGIGVILKLFLGKDKKEK